MWVLIPQGWVWPEILKNPGEGDAAGPRTTL